MTRTHRLSLYTLAALAAVTFTPPLSAADYTWIGSSGNWSDPANWLGGNIPQGLPSDQILFPATSFTTTVTADHDPWILNGITFEGAGPITISSANTAGIQFDGTAPSIVRLGTDSGSATMTSPVILNQTTTFSQAYLPGPYANSNLTTTLAGTVSGPGGLVVQSGFLQLSAANTFSGGVTIHGNTYPRGGGSPPPIGGTTLFVNNPQALGTGPLNLLADNVYVEVLLLADISTTFNNDVFVTGATNRLLTTSTTGSTPAGTTVTLGQLTFQSGDSNITLGGSNTSLPGPTSYVFAGLTLAGNATINQYNSLGVTVTTGAISESGGAHSLTLGRLVTLTITSPSTFSGGTLISGDDDIVIPTTINANVGSSLGSGPVTMLNGLLTLNATNAVNNTVTASSATATVKYNANGAAGGHLITIGRLFIDPTVSSFSNGAAADSFAILPGGFVSADGTRLAMLDRATNFTPGFGTILENTSGGLPTAQNLGTAGDLLIGLVSAYSGDLALGTGTPWLGISGGSNVTYTGTLTVASNIVLQSPSSYLTLGSSTAGSFNIIPASGTTPVAVSLQNVTLNASLANYSGVAKFTLVGGTLDLSGSNALGGGSASAPAPLEIASLGTLRVHNTTALNANLKLDAGSFLGIYSAGVSGSGTITRDNQPITVDLENSAALTGPQLIPSFFQPGDTVLLNANNVTNLKNIDPGANYTLHALGPTAQQAEGLDLNGGSLFFQSADSALQAGPVAKGDSTIRIGPLGATIAAFGSYNIPYSSWGAGIQVPIIAQGPVDFGYPTNPPINTSGAIILTNTSNQFSTISVNQIALVAAVPKTLTGATINLKGGRLALLSTNTGYPVPPAVYSNTISVLSDATLSDNTANIDTGAISPPLRTTGPITISTVNLATATLTLNIANGITINTLNLTGDATLTRNVGQPAMTINSITQDGATPRALSFAQPSEGNLFDYTVTGQVSATGPVNISVSGVEFDGTVTSSSASVTVGPSGGVAGTGTIHRPVVFTGGGYPSTYLLPGGHNNSSLSTPGTLTVDSLALSSNTTLQWNLATPNVTGGTTNDLVAVLGNLTLDGSLVITPGTGFGLGTYTLFTYAGTLTDNGLVLPPSSGNIVYTLDTTHPGLVNLHRGLLGDANDDGLVNFADFVLLSNNFGKTCAGWCGADFNNDGLTNFSDFVTLSNNFGATMGSSDVAAAATGSGVPEPASLIILGAGFLSIFPRRRPPR